MDTRKPPYPFIKPKDYKFRAIVWLIFNIACLIISIILGILNPFGWLFMVFTLITFFGFLINIAKYERKPHPWE